MSGNVEVRGHRSVGDEGSVTEVLVFLSQIADTWDCVGGVDVSRHEGTIPMEARSDMWWLPMRAMDLGLFGSTDEMVIVVFRQPVEGRRSGSLFPVEVEIHRTSGAARIKSFGEQLVGFEPGFMAPLSVTLCRLLDWLVYGHQLKCLRIGDKDKGDFVDDDGLFADDDGSVLRSLCSSRFNLAKDVKTESVEVVDEVPPLQTVSFVDDMVVVTESEPVRIGSNVSVGSQAGRVNCAALAMTSLDLDASSSDDSSVESGVEIASL